MPDATYHQRQRPDLSHQPDFRIFVLVSVKIGSSSSLLTARTARALGLRCVALHGYRLLAHSMGLTDAFLNE